VKQLTFLSPRELEWREVAEPRLGGETEALVIPIAASNCDLDTWIVRGSTPFTGPFAIGHEFVAKVVEIGAGVADVNVGDVVIVPWKVFCGECEQCRRGCTTGCTSFGAMSMYGLPLGEAWGSGLSDLVRVPFADRMLVTVPSGVSPEVLASASDNIPDGWRCVGPQLRARPGSEVLVLGGGGRSAALYAVGIAVALGARRVDYVDHDADRLRIAEDYGANPIETREPPAALGPYPITVNHSTTPAGLQCALRSTETGGTCTQAGILFEDAPVPLFDMYRAALTVRTGPCETRTFLPDVLDLIVSGRFDPTPVTSEIVSWADAPDAYARLKRKTVVVRD
jgi:threonine dehydrogenase-like Zn-dependent dehydrogenase